MANLSLVELFIPHPSPAIHQALPDFSEGLALSLRPHKEDQPNAEGPRPAALLKAGDVVERAYPIPHNLVNEESIIWLRPSEEVSIGRFAQVITGTAGEQLTVDEVVAPKARTGSHSATNFRSEGPICRVLIRRKDDDIRLTITKLTLGRPEPDLVIVSQRTLFYSQFASPIGAKLQLTRQLPVELRTIWGPALTALAELYHCPGCAGSHYASQP